MFEVYEILNNNYKYFDNEYELMDYLNQYDYFEVDNYVEIRYDYLDRNRASKVIDPHDYM